MDSLTVPVTVYPLPVAGFTAASGACVGETVTFTNTSTGASTYSWDFGDGTTSTLSDPTHAYGGSGTFTIELTATTAFGCVDITTTTILVDTIPIPLFEADTVCLLGVTSFTNLTT